MEIFRKAFMQHHIALHDTSISSRHPVGARKSDIDENEATNELTTGEKVVKYGVAGVGLTCTLLALYGIIRTSLRGESRRAQKYMRYRIMAQFFTVSAVSACLMYFALKHRESRLASEKGDAVKVSGQPAHH